MFCSPHWRGVLVSRALSNAHGEGELRSAVDPREEADFFTASVLGLFVMLRATAPPTVIKSATRVALKHLEGLRAEVSTGRRSAR